MKKLHFEYRESFAVPQLLTSDEVTALLAELDPFLDGFFLGLAHENVFDLLCPVVDSFEHTVIDDEKLGISRIKVLIKISMKMVTQQEYPTLQRCFNDAISAFLGSRFPNAGKDEKNAR